MHNDSLYALTLEARILNGVLMRLIRSDLDRRLHPHGLGGWLQHAALASLAEHSLTSRDLSKQLRVEPATLVPVIDALERDGFVTRGHDPDDRRRTPLSLTQHGQDVLRTVPTVHPDDVILRAFAGMGEHKSRKYIELLRELMQRASGDEEMVQQVTATAERHIARERKGKRTMKTGSQSGHRHSREGGNPESR